MTEFRTTPVLRSTTNTPSGTREALRCKGCNTIILSMRRHDFVECNCEKDRIFIDGGQDYTRAGGDFSKMESILIKVGPETAAVRPVKADRLRDDRLSR